MAFFLTDNPIALFVTLVVVLVILKAFLSRQKLFEGKRQSYLLPALILIAIILLAYRPLLRMLSFGIPLFILLLLFLFAVGAGLFIMGMKMGTIWPALKEVGPLKTALQIAVFCIIAFAASHVYGEKLLEDKTVTVTGAVAHSEEPVKIDFSPVFTKQALGLVLIISVLGFAFFFVNFSE